MDELRVSAPYEVGVFKYLIGYNKNNERVPMEVYIEECQLNITPVGGSGIVEVETKYKVRNKRGNCYWAKPIEILNTKEDVLKRIEYYEQKSNGSNV